MLLTLAVLSCLMLLVALKVLIVIFPYMVFMVVVIGLAYFILKLFEAPKKPHNGS